METPWVRAKKTKSELQERRNAKLPAGSRQVNSGRFWRWKRDNKVWNFLVESRTTESGSYSVNRKEFEQIRQEAITEPPGHKPAMQIDIQELNLWLMELTDWEAVLTHMIELEARVAELEEALENSG